MKGDNPDADAIDELLVGAIDVHVHANPHQAPQIHAQDVLALIQQAQLAGMRALIIKDVGGSTTGAAYVASRASSGFPIYGILVMNLAVGGVNPRAVYVALNHGDGARIVHFPTGDSRNHFEYRKKYYFGVNLPLKEEEAITVVNDGRLVPAAREVIGLVKEHGATLATAHMSAAETRLIVREAKDQGLERIVISHALWGMTGLTMDDLKSFAAQGCLIELECCQTMPMMHFVHGETPVDPRFIVKVMKEIGPEHCFISSDLGQLYSPLPVEGMRSYVAMLCRCGMTADDIRVMFHRNPARIAGLQ